MPKLEKFLEMPTHAVDESIKEYTNELFEKVQEAMKSEIRFAFRNALIDTGAISCIKVAEQYGFTELAKEMIAEMKEMEESNV